MCLTKKLKIPKYLKTGEHFGYKVFKVRSIDDSGYPTLVPVILPRGGDYKYKLFGWNVDSTLKKMWNWIRYELQFGETGLVLESHDGKLYRGGYHIFPSKRGALRYYNERKNYGNCYIYKVRYKEVLAYGMQNDSYAVVAKRFEIIDIDYPINKKRGNKR